MKHDQSTAGVILDPTALFLQDPALLSDGPSIDLHFSFDGGVIIMRSHDALVLHENAEEGWRRLDGGGRARLLASWIHTAAEQYRARLSKRRGERKKPVVA